MIQEAHIGVGISGNEGTQAVQSSDYAIAQFSYLKRLLLVHGRRNYERIAFVILYSFYKNVTCVWTLFLYTLYNNVTGTSAYMQLFTGAFNVVWTFLPILWFGVTDYDLKDVSVVDTPDGQRVYKRGIMRMEFNFVQFTKYVVLAIIHGSISFFICMFTYSTSIVQANGYPEEYYTFTSSGYVVLIIFLNAKIALQLRAWNWVTAFVLAISVLPLPFFFIPVYSQFKARDYYGVVNHLLGGQAVFWLLMLLVPIAVLYIDYTVMSAQRMFFPLGSMILQERALHQPARESGGPDGTALT